MGGGGAYLQYQIFFDMVIQTIDVVTDSTQTTPTRYTLIKVFLWRTHTTSLGKIAIAGWLTPTYQTPIPQRNWTGPALRHKIVLHAKLVNTGHQTQSYSQTAWSSLTWELNAVRGGSSLHGYWRYHIFLLLAVIAHLF